MDESNRIVQGLWLGSALGTMESLCIRSFLRRGHTFHLYSYEPLQNVPEGTIEKDAREVLDWTVFDPNDFTSKHAVFSDIFRYKLIAECGGWWADLDTYCLKPFDFESDYVFDSDHIKVRMVTGDTYTSGEKVLRDPFGSPTYIINGNFKAPKGAKLLEHMYNKCSEMNPKEINWKTTGPSSFTATILDTFPHLLYCVLPLPLLNPLSWQNLSILWTDGNKPSLPAEAYAVHLYRSNWVEAGADMDTRSGMYGLLRVAQEYDVPESRLINMLPSQEWFTEEWTRCEARVAPQVPQGRPLRRFHQ